MNQQVQKELKAIAIGVVGLVVAIVGWHIAPTQQDQLATIAVGSIVLIAGVYHSIRQGKGVDAAPIVQTLTTFLPIIEKLLTPQSLPGQTTQAEGKPQNEPTQTASQQPISTPVPEPVRLPVEEPKTVPVHPQAQPKRQAQTQPESQTEPKPKPTVTVVDPNIKIAHAALLASLEKKAVKLTAMQIQNKLDGITVDTLGKLTDEECFLLDNSAFFPAAVGDNFGLIVAITKRAHVFANSNAIE